MLKLVAIALLILSLAACQPPGAPRQPDPGVAPPAAWKAPAADGELAPGWWNSFGDPKLDVLIAETLAHNPTLKGAAARIAQAEAQAVIAGADLYPHLAAGASGTKSKAVSSSSGNISRPSRLGVSLELSWELDLWGRIRSGRLAALEDVYGARALWEASRLSLAGQTAKGWFLCIESWEQRKLASDTVENHRATADMVRERYKMGLSPALDLRLSLSNLARSRSILVIRRETYQRSLRQLEALLGRYPSGEVKTATRLPGLPAPVPAGLPSTLLSRRPDLASSKAKVYAAQARLAQAKAALLPRLSLTASGGASSPALSELVNLGANGFWNLVANLTAPIFQGGRLRAQVDLNKALEDESFAAYAATALTAFTEVEQALTAEQLLAERVMAVKTYADEARAARELAELRYQQGLIDFNTLLSTQRTDLEAQSSFLETRRVRLTNRVDLYLALGGGFTAPHGPWEKGK